MNEITELWVAKDKFGKLTLFFEEPWNAEGEWYSNSCQRVEIKDDLVSSDVSYLDSPQRVYLSVVKE